MRTTNAQKLKELIKALGENGVAKAALGANVNVGTLQKLCAGTYGRVPRQATRDRLCAFFRVPESEIFPASTDEKRSA
jgi:hypothetical protein